MSHVMPFLLNTILKHILSHFWDEGALTLREFNLCNKLYEPQFFHDFRDIEFFLDFSDSFLVQAVFAYASLFMAISFDILSTLET